MTTTKLLLDTLKLADNGRVVCDVATPDGDVVKGAIEKAFFEDFMGVPDPKIPTARRAQIISDNMEYFEREAERQWQMGMRELVIR